MERVALYVSDIEGTLPPCNSENNEDYVLFFKTLSEIGKKSGADKVLFTLSSTGNKDEVIKKMEQLASYMTGLNIQYANQYCNNECFDRKGSTISCHKERTSKPGLMINQMASLQANGSEIMWAGFADDLGEIYPDIDEISTCFPNVPSAIIYPEFGQPLPFEHIISTLQNEAASFENSAQKK